MREKRLKLHPLTWMLGISTLILFVCSSTRHALFQSTAWDLGIFDQVVYLISQGQTPISSFLNFHILGDHAALIFYPLALLYKIYPDVHWLLAVQAIALSSGALPTWYLARQAGLKDAQATTIAAVYLLYPLIFNINLFDFHPDVFAPSAILWAVLAARTNHLWGFCLAIVVILACKEAFALTVIALGIWLLVFEKKRLYGSIVIAVGIAWFLVATKIIIPSFASESGTIGRHLSRYAHLGNSFVAIVQNFFLKPWLLLSAIFNQQNLEYLVLLLVPFIWGLSPRHLTPLVGAIPALTINFLANDQAQKDLVHQYSLPILPFLLLAVIATLAAGDGWLQNRRRILLWSLVMFLALAKWGYFGQKYLSSLDTWQATREAVAKITQPGSVLTSAQIAPHVTHRPIVKLALDDAKSVDLNQFDYVLLNQRYPGWQSSPETVTYFLDQLKQNPAFKLDYARNQVFLFEKQ